MLAVSTTASSKVSGNKLKAGCSTCAVTVHPGRDSEPVVSSVEEWFPRSELVDDSSLLFIVRWERLRDVVLTRLTEPALYDVSVRSLAALVRM